MGTGRSKQLPISYEEACRRVDKQVLTRIEGTFKRLASNSGYLPQITFQRDVMGESVPPKLADGIYHALGGSQKGIGMKDLFCGLVLLTHGTIDEKAKFLAQLVSQDGEHVTKDNLQALIEACDGRPTDMNLNTLFLVEPYCSIEHFEGWVKTHVRLASFTRWLLQPEGVGMEEEQRKERGFWLEAEPDPPNFYQHLAELHGLEVQDVMDLEKTYWGLKGTGKFDQETLELHVCPPVPKELCEALFSVVDMNHDGHIDLSEMVSLVSVCCRQNDQERHKLCFRVFDSDGDGLLSREDLTRGVGLLMRLREENTLKEGAREDRGTEEEGGEGGRLEEEVGEREDGDTEDGEAVQNVCKSVVEFMLAEYSKECEDHLTEQEYVQWAEQTPLSRQLSNVMFEVCHAKFGLRPKDRGDEARVVSGYMVRFKKAGRSPGDTVYLISAEWFNSWTEYTSCERSATPSTKNATAAGGKRRKQKSNHRKHRVSPEKARPRSQSQQQAQFPPLIPLADSGETKEVAEEALELITLPNDRPAGKRTSGVSVESEASGNSSALEEDLHPGPVDNSVLCVSEPGGSKKLPSLTNEGGRLLKLSRLLVEGKDFVLLPEVVWRVFISWYGAVGNSLGPALPRIVGGDGMVELYPVSFKIYRHTTIPPPAKPSSLPWPLSYVFGSLGLTSPTPVAMPLLPQGGGTDSNPTQPPLPRRVCYYQAAFGKCTTVKEMCDEFQRILHIKPEDLRIYNFSDDDSPVLLEDETVSVESLGFGDGQKLLIETRNKDNSWPEELIAIIKEVQAKDREKEKVKAHPDVRVPPGATGLSNLGNTCFMNSALQCVSNTQALTQYFREREHLLELNKDNPLGTGGVMAKRYGELVQDLWGGNSKSITPLRFRFTVGRHAPRFNGFQQQDSQELLSFVLDGLHEDLNRVKEKPYMELKDSDGRPDEEVAKEAWDYHLSRNQSVIVDLFQGQLKSVVTCKVCGYKSVRFDPFTFLSLPLPADSTVDLEVIVVCLDGSQPVRYGLKVEVDEKYNTLKEALSELCGIPTSRLLLVEVFGATIRNFPADTTKIHAMLGGWLYAFEVPEAPPVKPTPRSESPDEATRQRKFAELRRERTLSMKVIQEEKERAARAREMLRRKMEEEGRMEGEEEYEREATAAEEIGSRQDPEVPATSDRKGEESAPPTTEVSATGDRKGEESAPPTTKDMDNDKHEDTQDQASSRTEVQVESTGDTEKEPHPPAPPDHTPSNSPSPDNRGFVDTDEASNILGGEMQPGSTQGASPRGSVVVGIPSQRCVLADGFIFAMHRRIYPTEHYFISFHKNRPALFGFPVVVPCTPATLRREVYQTIWTQVKRLIIPEPPDEKTSEEQSDYCFGLRWVGKDGLSCATCPWYRFCRGCPIPCDEAPLGNTSSYVAIDWDNTTLHLRYQTAQERPIEDKSMEALKTVDTTPINLYDCFKAFVREDQLGEEESWYCKECKKHQEATKSLEIWRLPPILIIHLKRFQFVNGRWVKSQRVVQFPVLDLEPMRYTVQNGNSKSSGTSEPCRPDLATPSCPVESNYRSPSPTTAPEASPEPTEVKVEVHTPERWEGEEGVPVGAEGENGEPSEGELPERLEGGVAEGEGEGDEVTVQPQEAGEEEEVKRKPERNEEEEEEVDGLAEAASESLESEDINRERIYNLFAISSHSGILGGGHYVSFAKNPNGRWYYYNDSSCKETSEERVAQESPYMLFYELNGLDKDHYRAKKRGQRQDIGRTEDDREFEETLRNLRSRCCVQ